MLWRPTQSQMAEAGDDAKSQKLSTAQRARDDEKTLLLFVPAFALWNSIATGLKW